MAAAIKKHAQEMVPIYRGNETEMRSVWGGTSAIKSHCFSAGNQRDPYLTEGRLIHYDDTTIIFNENTTEIKDVLRNKQKLLCLADISRIATSQLDRFIKNVDPDLLQDTDILKALAARFRVADDTHKTYFGLVRKMCEFFKQQGFSTKSTVRDILTEIDQSVAFPHFLLMESQKKIAASSIDRFKHALFHGLRFFAIPITIDLTYAKQFVTMCQKVWGLAPKPTAAIPRRTLRFLFEFLETTDPKMFKFFAFAFFTASRVGEMLKLVRGDFTFSPPSAEKPWVKIKLRNTKTRSRFANDGHYLTFSKLRPLTADPTKQFLDPYELARYWYIHSGASPQDPVAPFAGTLSQRSRQLYAWFRHMKWDFKNWLAREKGIEIEVTKWRYHSMRTTFVGIMRGLGMSWEDIQLRTGHKFDSAVTRDTYFMNALMSDEFDEKFEEILDQNMDARTLFLLEGNFDDQATPEEQQAFRDNEKHRDLYNNPLLEGDVLPDLIASRKPPRKAPKLPKIPLTLSETELSESILRNFGDDPNFLNLLSQKKEAPKPVKKTKKRLPQISAKLTEQELSQSILREFGDSEEFCTLLPQKKRKVDQQKKDHRSAFEFTYSRKAKKPKRERLPRLKTHSLSLIRPNPMLQLVGSRKKPILPKRREKNIWQQKEDTEYVPTSFSRDAMSTSFSLDIPRAETQRITPIRERDGFPWCIKRSLSRPPPGKN